MAKKTFNPSLLSLGGEMKKALLIIAALGIVLGASSLVAANTNWTGKYICMDQGIWKGTIYDDPTGPAKPYFKGKWVSMDVNKQGTMYASLKPDGYGNYKIIKGTLYDINGNEVGFWDGYFTLMVKPGHGEGAWAWIDAAYIGKWTGQLALTDEE